MTATRPTEFSLLDPATLPLSGTSFIEASAGTGKTHALTTLYIRFVVERGLLPAEILVVTFTNAATAELRERIRDRLRESLASEPDEERQARIHRALRHFDEAAIFTIHGFCQRTLAESAFESGLAFETELLEKPDVVQATLAHDLASRLLADEPSSFRAWLALGAGQRWEFEPEALASLLAHELGGDEEMPLLPAQAESAEESADGVAALCGQVDRSWLRFAALWREQKEEVVDLLCTPKVLNGTRYKQATIRSKWGPELDLACLSIERAGSVELRVGSMVPERIARSLTREAIERGTNKGKTPPTHPLFEVASELVESTEMLCQAFDRRALGLRRRFVDAARAAAAIRRSERRLLFFDDLIGELRRALRGRNGEALVATLRKRHRVALIDEFQDTDSAQYEIFETVWHGEAVEMEGGALVLIGDPKQAIYAFRGADVETYLAARGDAGERVHSLAVNHRSDPELIEAVNALFSASSSPFARSDIGFARVGAANRVDRSRYVAPPRFASGLRISFLERDAIGAGDSIPLRFARTAWMTAVAADVADLLESGATIGDRPLRASDVAILARRKSELDAVRRALEALGIPCVSRGEGNVFDSREAWELVCVLAAWLHPGDGARLRAALSTGAHGLDAAALLQAGDDSPKLLAHAERQAEYGRLWLQQGFARAFETWRLREGVSEQLLRYSDGDRRLTNWLHLAELLARAEMQRSASRSGLLAWLERAIEDPALRIELGGDASLLRLERDDDAVSLVTFHRSKGLEWEVVYLPCLWEGFDSRDAPKSSAASEDDGEEPQADDEEARPGTRSSGTPRRRRPPIRFCDPRTKRRSLDLGDLSQEYDRHAALAEAEREAETRRLLYVAATRARRHCVVHWGCAGPKYGKSPLARLLLDARAQAESVEAGKFVEFACSLSDADWLAAWQAIAAAAPPNAIRIEPSRLEPRARWRSPSGAHSDLVFERALPLALRALATTSFSALVRAAPRALAPSIGPAAVGRDVDAEVEFAPERAPVEVAGSDPASADLAGDMHLFPRGADAGTLLHEVLERVDLARCDEAEIESLAREWLKPSGLDARVVPQVVHVVRSVARTLLRGDPHPLRLGDLPPSQILPELEFTLAAPGDAHGRGFSADALARILDDALPGSPLRRHAERVRALSWPVLSGHLRGFIDAVFCDGERYYVVDYKSNHLGDRRDDYHPERLIAPMMEHDYLLQSLLYCVALDRHLAVRLADYDYERHFGGSYYLFLRGLAESHPAGCGIFFDRPQLEIVRRVSALLGTNASEVSR